MATTDEETRATTVEPATPYKQEFKATKEYLEPVSMVMALVFAGLMFWLARQSNRRSDKAVEFVAHQLDLARQQNERAAAQHELLLSQTRATGLISVATALQTLNERVFANPEILAALNEAYAPRTDGTTGRAASFMYMRVNLYELVSGLFDAAVLPADQIPIWEGIIRNGIDTKFGRDFWNANKKYYGLNFRKLVSRSLNISDDE